MAKIILSTIQELQLIGRDSAFPIDGEYELGCDIDATVTRNWSDWQGQGFDFIPIFKGTLNGKGFKIHGLYVNRPSRNTQDLYFYYQFTGGLFGWLYDQDVVIQNLILEDFEVIGNRRTTFLAGTATNTFINNIHIRNSILKGGWGSCPLLFQTSPDSGSEYAIRIENCHVYNNDITIVSSSDWQHVGLILGKTAYGSQVRVGKEFIRSTCAYNNRLIVPSEPVYKGIFVGETDNYTRYENCYQENNTVTYANGYPGVEIVSGWTKIGGAGAGAIIQNAYAASSTGTPPSGINTSVGVYNDYQVVGASSYQDGIHNETTVNMKKQATFVGWDFENIWYIIENTDYPRLRPYFYTDVEDDREVEPPTPPPPPPPSQPITDEDRNWIRNGRSGDYQFGILNEFIRGTDTAPIPYKKNDYAYVIEERRFYICTEDYDSVTDDPGPMVDSPHWSWVRERVFNEGLGAKKFGSDGEIVVYLTRGDVTITPRWWGKGLDLANRNPQIQTP